MGSLSKHKNKKQREILNWIQAHNLNPKERMVIGRVKCLAGEDGWVSALESNSKWWSEMNGSLLQADTSKTLPLLYALTPVITFWLKLIQKKAHLLSPLLVSFFFCLPLYSPLQPFLASAWDTQNSHCSIHLVKLQLSQRAGAQSDVSALALFKNPINWKRK